MVYTLTVKDQLPGRGPKDEKGRPTDAYVLRKDLSRRIFVEKEFMAPSEVLRAGKELVKTRLAEAGNNYILRAASLLGRTEVVVIIIAKKYLPGRL